MSEKTLEELEFEETGVTRKERWKVMWASILGYAMDGLDVLILSFAMAAIVSEFGLTLGEGGLIATYTMIGTVLGGYLFGIMADYVGRVHTFAVTIILFSIFTGACAFADSATHLEIFRFLAGLGLGGEYGIGMTLVSETWPAAKRARATAGVAMGWQAGAVLAPYWRLCWLRPSCPPTAGAAFSWWASFPLCSLHGPATASRNRPCG